MRRFVPDPSSPALIFQGSVARGLPALYPCFGDLEKR
jgi:hypothetical protein